MEKLCNDVALIHTHTRHLSLKPQVSYLMVPQEQSEVNRLTSLISEVFLTQVSMFTFSNHC